MSAPQAKLVSLEDLKRSLAERPAAIHLGAGVSIALSGQLLGSYGFLTSGLELAREHRIITEDQFKRYRHALDSGDLQEQFTVGSFLEGRLRPQRKRFLEWLEKTVGNLPISNNAIAQPLFAAAQSGLLLSTTSYDHLLSKATGLPTVSWMDFHDIEQLQNPPTLLHLEGTWDKPDSIVIAVRQDQKASMHREAIQAFLSPLRFLLLVGVGPGFFTSTMCQSIQARRGTLPGALLCRAEEVDDFQRRLADSLQWFNIVPYEGGFKALPKVLEGLFGPFPSKDSPIKPSTKNDPQPDVSRIREPLPKPFTDFTADPERFASFLARLTFRHREGIPLLETLEPGPLSDLLRAANLLSASSSHAVAEQLLRHEEELKSIYDPPPLWLAWITRVRRHKLERLGRECIALAERADNVPDPIPSLSETPPATAPAAASEVSPRPQTHKKIETASDLAERDPTKRPRKGKGWVGPPSQSTQTNPTKPSRPTVKGPSGSRDTRK